MSKNHKYLKKKAPVAVSNKILIAAIVVVVLLIAVVLVLIFAGRGKEVPVSTEPAATTEVPTEATTAPTEATTVPTEAAVEMLPNMAELYAKNPDVVGWIRIDGTKLDYPVMYTPEDETKYLHANFEGSFDFAGVPYIQKSCSLDPESQNLIIYGHNMQTGTHFRPIMGYDQIQFLQAHPKIYFSTLYEEREYEIFACFYDRIKYTYEDGFRFYRFIDPETEEEFNEGIEYFKNRSLHETGITPEYGDKLIMLVTCAYHVDNGRFVVVGRLIEDEPIEETAAATE